MKKATRGHKLGIRDMLRNGRISKKRSHIERCFAVMKRAHKAGHVLVTCNDCCQGRDEIHDERIRLQPGTVETFGT